MVKHKFFSSALGALVVVCVIGTAAAGSQFRITGSPYGPEGNAQYMPLATGGTAVQYGEVGGQFTAQVDLNGFLACNYVDTGLPSSISLAARHGAWNFGSIASSNEGGVVASVPGINLVDYNGQTLTLDADLLDANGGLQCFQANEHGQGVSDLNHLFVGSFDSGVTGAGSPNTSSVKIEVTALPEPDPSDQKYYKFVVTVSIGNQYLPNSQAQPQSQATTDYYLNEGYDTNVFDYCNIVPGLPVASTDAPTHEYSCTVRPGVDLSTLDPTIPVVSAALFTGPNAQETDFSDNLAFGYPVVSAPQ